MATPTAHFVKKKGKRTNEWGNKQVGRYRMGDQNISYCLI